MYTGKNHEKKDKKNPQYSQNENIFAEMGE